MRRGESRWRGPRWARSAAGAAALVLTVVVCGACQASTVVAVSAGPGGSGAVTVTVALDRAADLAVGGLASQLDTAGLAAQGWVVGPVTGTAGGGSAVTARHSYTTPGQLSAVVASIAGAGTAPVVELALRHTHGLWQDHTTVTGRVDLSCGVGCFGDRGLAASTGSPLGFDVAKAAAQAGVTPAQALTFQVGLTLPGTVRSSNATSRAGRTLVWRPALGRRVLINETTRTWNTRTISAAAVAAGLLFLLLVVGAWLLWRRRRRRRGGVPTAGRRSSRSHAGSEVPGQGWKFRQSLYTIKPVWLRSRRGLPKGPISFGGRSWGARTAVAAWVAVLRLDAVGRGRDPRGVQRASTVWECGECDKLARVGWAVWPPAAAVLIDDVGRRPCRSSSGRGERP